MECSRVFLALSYLLFLFFMMFKLFYVALFYLHSFWFIYWFVSYLEYLFVCACVRFDRECAVIWISYLVRKVYGVKESCFNFCISLYIKEDINSFLFGVYCFFRPSGILLLYVLNFMLKTLLFFSNFFILFFIKFLRRCKMICSLFIKIDLKINCLFINIDINNNFIKLDFFIIFKYLIVSLFCSYLLLYFVFSYSKLNYFLNIDYILLKVTLDGIINHIVYSDYVKEWSIGISQGLIYSNYRFLDSELGKTKMNWQQKYYYSSGKSILNKEIIKNYKINPNIIEEDINTLIKKNNTTSKVSNLSLAYDLNSPIFKNLLSILTNNLINEETQIKMEKFLINKALDLTKVEEDSKNKSKISNTLILKLIEKETSIIKLIKNYIIKLNIMEDDLNHQIWRKMDIKFIINIIFGRIITIISNNHLINNKTSQVEVTIDLGKEIINKYMLDSYKEVKIFNPNLTFIKWKQENKKLVDQTDDIQLKFNLGNILINFIFDLKLIKNEVKVLAKDEKKTILVAGSELVKFIPKLNNSFSIQSIPNRLPMVVPGKIYKYIDNQLELGGYLLNGEEYTDEIILSNWELSSNSKLLERNDIIDMVNKINSVAFKINENVLDFILSNNDKYGFFTNPSDNHPLTLKNDKQLSLSEQKEIESFNSKKHLELNILGLATIFRNVPNLYFPVRLDYRGRLYCVTEYLNYQGIELSKGLLLFSKGEEVSLKDDLAIKYLKIFGANCFGNKLDKKSFNDRIEWIDNNIENIINFDNGVLLKKAENKIVFLSFCFEYSKYNQALNNNDLSFNSNLPIQLDASCNGFQHLSLLVDDLALSKELNLNKAKWEDMPKDFYSFIALKIKNFFSKSLDEYDAGKLKLNPENKESYAKLAKVEIFRALIKKAVMTTPYNASTYSIIEYLKENFDKVKNPNFTESSITNMDKNNDYYLYVPKIQKSTAVIYKEIDFKNLRKALNFVLFIDYPKLTALAEYLKDIANISNKLKIPIPWILPTGLEINQQYFEKKILKVKPFIYNKNMLNITVLNKKQFNKNKQKIALMPNLVHSLDAASLCLVIVNYFKLIDNINFYSIHDCFAVPCNKVSHLIGLLRSAYCIIYTENKYLIEFDDNFKNTIIKSYGESAVTFDIKKGKLAIKLKNENITLKYPSINKIIDIGTTNTNLINSNYLIH